MSRTSILLVACLVAVPVFLSATGSALAGSTEKVLHSFRDDGVDGHFPNAVLVFDRAGNLYGETEVGGSYGYGAVFELTPAQNGQWNENVLHSFNGTDGADPEGGVAFDGAGGLYGTTSTGGTGTCQDGCGRVFRWSLDANGGWNATVLYNFHGGDGCWPRGALVADAAGNLYGTTDGGGAYESCGACGCGTVFELVRGTHGQWTEKILYNFTGGYDGEYPQSGLIFDAKGNLYGTTGAGGNYGAGTVFELVRGSHGSWAEKVLHGFTYGDYGKGGVSPWATPIFDTAGNLYGTTVQGGAFWSGCVEVGCGTVFKLRPRKEGTWSYEVLHSFGNAGDGTAPYASLVLDAAGNLYGTTFGGGANGSGCVANWGCGTVFKLTRQPNGEWVETILHSFEDNNKDASNPFSGLIFDPAGNLLGTGSQGGTFTSSCEPYQHGCGAVFEIKP